MALLLILRVTGFGLKRFRQGGERFIRAPELYGTLPQDSKMDQLDNYQ